MLDLSHNELSGRLPPEWGALTNLQTLYLYGNQLSGDIPPDFINLTQLQGFMVKFNQLTANPTVTDFINNYDSDWQAYQTVPPTNLVATTTNDGIQLNWTPILYQANGGYYEVGYFSNADEPYTVELVSGDKTASSHTITGLSPNTTYYLVVRTYTPSHDHNPNALTSWWSTTISATTTTQTFSLNITINGSGSVSSSPAGIACGTDCDESYSEATSVTLTAEPAADSLFNGWDGDCAGQSSPAVLLVDAAKTCTAHFLALTCQPAVYSVKTQRLTLPQLALEMYFPLTDQPHDQYALCRSQGTRPLMLKYQPRQDGFKFQSNPTISCAEQFLAPSELSCFSRYSAQQQTLTLPQVKITPADVVFPGEKLLKNGACYRATLVQGLQPLATILRPSALVDSELFTLISAEEIACQ